MTGGAARTWLAMATALATPLAMLGAPARALAHRGIDARLQGNFAMRGTLTYVDHVFGEHRGQHVTRRWTFFQSCDAIPCRRVRLVRRRGSRHQLDVLTLYRRGRGLYVGTGRFWLPLRCGGSVVKFGGIATETITLRIMGTRPVGSARFATELRATYVNPQRTNLTRCPGGIGHDAATYSGTLASPLPRPPIASFTAQTNLLTSTATFTDGSHPTRGGPPIVAWSWNFGDSLSPSNTSTQRNPSHHFTPPGIYTVRLSVRDKFGQTATSSEQVTV